MSKQVEIEQLRSIKTLPQLIRYLRDELDWPIDQDAAEDVATFEYSLEEIGLGKDYADIIKEVKQIRPLDSKQPWGIFWVNFDKQRLPVAILRRILGSLAIKKRTKGSKSQQAAWHAHDLMFISAYGEASDRAVTFAHFSQNPENPNDLPALKVLGWDDDDTSPHLSDVHNTLKEKLRWPTNSENPDAWRKQWASAFVLGHREVITTTEEMVEELARLATAIYKRTMTAIKKESEKGPLRRLHAAFKTSLIHDLDEDGFADVIAQTISYGLLTARFSRPAGITTQNLVDMVPPTNPFLRELLGTFLHLAGRRSIFDFDELGIQDVVELLNKANTEAVKNDFGNKTRGEDPVIHFYEHFLSAYNKEIKIRRGVFYTPQPIVSYIVRSVHELLQAEFGLEDGLASTVTWAEMKKRNKDLKIPEGVEKGSAFVQILDPATGTATFLIEVVDIIHKTMMAKWQKQGMDEKKKTPAWNEYVPEHLLTRLHGYELMMAPYAIAHMKIGLKLVETGYHFGSNERARIYLTNALEPAQDYSDRLAFDVPALAHEAQAVSAIKRHQRFTIVVGNPPYAAFSSNPSVDKDGNLTTIGLLIDDYKFVAGQPVIEKKWWIQDDYVKFIRLTEQIISEAGAGIVSMITNHSYLDNPTFRGMRWHMLQSFSGIFVLNLHGNTKTAGKDADVVKDQNVFDIQQGVAVFVAVSSNLQTSIRQIQYADFLGPRNAKYQKLLEKSVSATKWNSIAPKEPNFMLIPQDLSREAEYVHFEPLENIFIVKSVGFVTARDALTIANTEEEIWDRVRKLLALPSESARIKFDLGEDARDWKVEYAQADLKASGPSRKKIAPVCYRPFDIRFTYYSGKSRGFIGQPQRKVMNHLIGGDNLALVTTRQQSVVGNWTLVWISNMITESSYISNKTAEINYVFPLKLIDQNETLQAVFDLPGQRTNMNPKFIAKFQQVLGSALEITSEGIFLYAYAVLHSTGYRTRYAEFLKIDFPRLPLTSNTSMFRALSKIGAELVDLHLLRSSKLDKHITKIVGDTKIEIEKIVYSDQTVWADKAKTMGFKGVPEDVWNFHIGGYQVCEKWLKDRKGRKLTKDDIDHYQKIVMAISETILLMAEIDKVIDKHCGWPGAFADKNLKK